MINECQSVGIVTIKLYPLRAHTLFSTKINWFLIHKK
jgi:hypothetical protein